MISSREFLGWLVTTIPNRHLAYYRSLSSHFYYMSYPTAVRFVRKLRGGSQAHLIQAQDNHFYAVKSGNNPQGTRVLVNEYLGSKVFSEMGIATAIATPIEVSQEFLASNPAIGFEFRNNRIPVRPGLHLGSRYEVPPDTTAVYDFIPEPLIFKVNNAPDFLGALIADQWLSNQDARQFVFFREQTADPIGKPGFRSIAIDHGSCLGGPKWNLFDSPLAGVYFQPAIYRSASSEDLGNWLRRLDKVDEERLGAWASDIPSEWLANEGDALQFLIAKLLKRKLRMPTLIEAAIEAHLHWFPSWNERKSQGYADTTLARNNLPISA